MLFTLTPEYSADCIWSEWNLGECSASCDGGNRMDARTKQGDDLNGGQCDPMIEKRTVGCNTESCPCKFAFYSHYWHAIFIQNIQVKIPLVKSDTIIIRMK